MSFFLSEKGRGTHEKRTGKRLTLADQSDGSSYNAFGGSRVLFAARKIFVATCVSVIYRFPMG